MIKGKPWIPATLKAVGGMEGIGVSFLEETFASPAANPKHRLHQKAARAVLRALLPDSGTEIKGTMRSHQELIAASGYATRPKSFVELLRILDRETRLITPTDPSGTELSERTPSEIDGEVRYYQLTHDYLVHSLRDWLTRKQKETLRGRAELRLQERAAQWSSKPETRQLPSLVEWARIRLFTRNRDWKSSQRRMMGKADRFHVTRFCAAASILILLAAWAWDYHGQLKAGALEETLLRPGMGGVSHILDEMSHYRRWVQPRLQEIAEQAESENDAEKQLKVQLALLRWDSSQSEAVYTRMLDADSQDFAVLRSELASQKDQLIERLWFKLGDQVSETGQRFRAACALAQYAPTDVRWKTWAGFVTGKLVEQNSLVLGNWADALQPAACHLLPALASTIEENHASKGERPTLIGLYAKFSQGIDNAASLLEEKLASGPVPGITATERARRKANVATALVALGHPAPVWPLLIHSEDPTVRSFLIERLGDGEIDPRTLFARLHEEKTTTARRALILTLGGVPQDRLPELGLLMADLYENDPDPGIHAASGWLLRKWKLQEPLEKIDIRLSTGQVEGNRRWYLNKLRQPLSIIEGPIQLMQGKRNGVGGLVHRFAIGATEVTVKQFRASKIDRRIDEKVTPVDDLPVSKVSWYDAAEYCNWLSVQDGFLEDKWCYRKKGKVLELVPDYQQRPGYRLPTEKEWEFACRAGAKTSWSFGEADEALMGRYACWLGNSQRNGKWSAFPVAILKPNDWGLFDMHGNLAEICQESEAPSGQIPDDVETNARGGSFVDLYGSIKCSSSFPLGRKFALNGTGFRVVRTILEK
jgi:hypothetical protein